MMRLTEFKRHTEIDLNQDEDDDEGDDEEEVTQVANSNDINDENDYDDEVDLFNRETHSNGHLANNHAGPKAKRKRNRNGAKKDKLEKIMQRNSATDDESLFMKFFKYILLNLTFALNVGALLIYLACSHAFTSHSIKSIRI